MPFVNLTHLELGAIIIVITILFCDVFVTILKI